MNTTRRFWLVLIGAILFLAVIACSCNSIIPTPAVPTATFPPPPTAPPAPTIPVNPMPALAGYWLDTDTQVVHTIEWQNGQYVVISAIDAEDGSYPINDQSWSNNTLTWTYTRPSTGTSVTFKTVSVNGDILSTTWTNSLGDSGTWDLERVSSPIPSTSTTGGQEPIPGLAGYWLDTDTEVVHTIEWQNGQYVVISAIDATEGSYPINDQSWSNNTLSWTYTRPSTGTSVTFVTVSVNGDILNTTWTNSLGDSGTWDLQRASSPNP
jgi:hypothetical protein